jgi:Domain of unknown function (DUF4129)
VLRPLALALLYLLGELMEFLQWLAHGIGIAAPHPAVVHQGPLRAPHPAIGRRSSGAHLPAPLSLALRWVAFVACVVAVAAVLSRAMTGFGERLRRDRGFDEERDSVWSWPEARSGILSLLSALRPHLSLPTRHVRHDGKAAAPRTIREVYRRMLRRLALAGRQRAPAETPHEYLERLRGIPISGAADAALLTSVYVTARYGDELDQAEDLENVVHALARLESALDQPPRTSDMSGEEAGTAN